MTKCSRVGCLLQAAYMFEWRNPKIHDESRIKTWGSCAAHEEYFVQYLSSRGFLVAKKQISKVTDVK